MKNFLKSFALAVAMLVSGPLSDGIPSELAEPRDNRSDSGDKTSLKR